MLAQHTATPASGRAAEPLARGAGAGGTLASVPRVLRPAPAHRNMPFSRSSTWSSGQEKGSGKLEPGMRPGGRAGGQRGGVRTRLVGIKPADPACPSAQVVCVCSRQHGAPPRRLAECCTAQRALSAGPCRVVRGQVRGPGGVETPRCASPVWGAHQRSRPHHSSGTTSARLSSTELMAKAWRRRSSWWLTSVKWPWGWGLGGRMGWKSGSGEGLEERGAQQLSWS
jgi:hypothetical protein